MPKITSACALVWLQGTFFEPLENVCRIASSRRVFHVHQTLLQVFCARAALLQLAVLLAQALRDALLGVVCFAQVGDDREKLTAKKKTSKALQRFQVDGDDKTPAAF